MPGPEKNLAAQQSGKRSARPVGGHVGDGHSSAGRIGGGEEAHDESKHGHLVSEMIDEKMKCASGNEATRTLAI